MQCRRNDRERCRPPSGRRVVRGGSWNNNDENLRSANRNNNDPGNSNNNLGLRLSSTSNLSARRIGFKDSIPEQKD